MSDDETKRGTLSVLGSYVTHRSTVSAFSVSKNQASVFILDL